MTSTIARMAENLEAAVQAVPGVERIYRPGSLAGALRDAGAAALGIRSDPSVIVSVTDAGIDAEVSIGVDGSLRAADVLEAVRQAMAEALSTDALPVHRLTVTVAHVQPHEATRL